ncbi:MAG: alpha/beta hydrolase [Pseudomonadota bacterium]
MALTEAYLNGPNGRIAYKRREASAPNAGPGLVWFGGFKSDMTGSKAQMVDEFAKHLGCACLRFDYTGHGTSDGVFEDGCVGEWAADALAAFDALTSGKQTLIGSSMGGWIAALTALARPQAVASSIFIAPAPDFTETLFFERLSPDLQERLMREGKLEQPSDFGDPYIYTKKLVEDGRQHLIMDGPININAPIRILQGMKDDAVPWRHALAFSEQLASQDVELTLVKDGDHRLSREQDLARLATVINEVRR